MRQIRVFRVFRNRRPAYCHNGNTMATHYTKTPNYTRKLLSAIQTTIRGTTVANRIKREMNAKNCKTPQHLEYLECPTSGKTNRPAENCCKGA